MNGQSESTNEGRELHQLRKLVTELKSATKHSSANGRRLDRIVTCFRSLEADPIENIRSLTELCGELLNATYVVYNRVEDGMLRSLGEWRVSDLTDGPGSDVGLSCYDAVNAEGGNVTVINDLRQTLYGLTDPNVIRFEMNTYMGCRVAFDGKPIGLLCAFFRDAWEPGPTDKSLHALIASAIGVEEKRMEAEEALKAHQENLEREVKQRTAELAETNVKLKREVNERRLAAEALKQSEARYKSLVESLPMGVIAFDSSGKILEVNPKALVLLGFSSVQEARASELLSVPALTRSGIADAIRSYLETGNPFEGEFVFPSNQGRQFHIRLHIAPMPDRRGKGMGGQAVLQDVTSFKQAQDLLIRTERQKTVGSMTGGVTNSVSHLLQYVTQSLNTALTGLEAGRSGEATALLEELLESTRSSAGTVMKLQQVARARTETSVFRWRVFDLSEVVAAAVDAEQAHADSSGGDRKPNVVIETELKPDCLVEGDETEVGETVVNLIRNAGEAIEESGTVRVRTFTEKGESILQVQDDGIGIPKKNLEMIFEPFWTSKEYHVGLGLAVNLGTIRRHGGKINVKTKPGRGAVFTVRFPRPVIREKSDDTIIREVGPLNFCILVIDDSSSMRRIMEKGFEGLGQRVLVASSGEEGLELFEENEVDAVICDLVMQDMSGWDVSKAIQGICVEKGMPKPPFIIVTGYARKLAESEIFSHPGVNRIVEKPVQLVKLLEVIREEIQEGTIVGHKLDLKFP